MNRRGRLVGGIAQPRRIDPLRAAVAIAAPIGALYAVLLLAMHSSLGSVRVGDRGAPAEDTPPAGDRPPKRGGRGGGGEPCRSVYLWGGHKSGSTTLSALLKHTPDGAEYDPGSQFVDSPKEVCWAADRRLRRDRWRRIRDGCVADPAKAFALDGCPYYRVDRTAALILEADPDARFVMLVRDPVDRLVSCLNAVRRKRRGVGTFDVEREARRLLVRGDGGGGRGGRRRNRWRQAADVLRGEERYPRRRRSSRHGRGRGRGLTDGDSGGGEETLDRIHWDLSLHGRNLENLLGAVPDPSRVLIVRTEALTEDPQQVVDEVVDHIGGTRREVRMLKQNDGSKLEGYQTISEGLRAELREAFRSDVEKLERLVGRRFPWSWTGEQAGVDNVLTWLSTVPKGQAKP